MSNGYFEIRKKLEESFPVWEKATIWERFKAACSAHPGRTFLITNSGESFTYSEVCSQAEALTAALAEEGIKDGTHVSVQLYNRKELVFILLALARLRAVSVLVNTELAPYEFVYVVSQSGSEFLITDRKCVRCSDGTHIKKIIALSGADTGTDLPLICYGDLRVNGELSVSDALSGAGDHADENACIVYTSGSSSMPKGVMLTHDMLLRSAYANCINRAFEQGRKVLVPLPMYHVYAYIEGLLSVILVNGTFCLWQGKFIAADILDFMEREKVNDLLCVPIQMMSLIDRMKEQPCHLDALEAVYCSASSCPEGLWQSIRDTFGIENVITGYGMTEVCAASTQTRPEDSCERLAKTVGRVLYAGAAGDPALNGRLIDYRVVDENGNDCPPGVSGELWCRGLTVTKGYYDLPKENSRSFTPDGWFKTGDCGYFDDTGYLHLVGRIDDQYKINGENISPRFLENIISNCPLVKHAEIIGVPDERHGNVGVAYIELVSDSPETRAGTEAFCRGNMAKYQVPKYYIYLTEAEWPLTSTGKVKKPVLKKMWLASHGSAN